MIHPPNPEATVAETETPAEVPAAKSWPVEVSEHLTRAAALCVEHGIDLDSWMRGTWNAYVESRPGYREYLEEQHMKTQLEELRKAGRLGQA